MTVVRSVFIALVLSGCGRLGFDEPSADAGDFKDASELDATVDATSDAARDAAVPDADAMFDAAVPDADAMFDAAVPDADAMLDAAVPDDDDSILHLLFADDPLDGILDSSPLMHTITGACAPNVACPMLTSFAGEPNYQLSSTDPPPAGIPVVSPAFSTTAGFTVTVFLGGFGDGVLIGKWSNALGDFSWVVYGGAGGTMVLRVRNPTRATNIEAGISASAGASAFFSFRYDTVTNQVRACNRTSCSISPTFEGPTYDDGPLMLFGATGTGWSITGNLRDLRLYDRALSDADVAAIAAM